jgi:hypothetical protein
MKILVLSQNTVDIYGGAVENRYGVEYASKILSNEEVTNVMQLRELSALHQIPTGSG